MQLLLSSVLLVYLWALSYWGVSSAMFVVSQGPDVSVMEWEAASISCCWTEKLERTSVNWLKNQKEFKSESIISKTKCPEEQCTCSTLTFTKITRGDSGTYVCRVTVEIPVYTVVEGNGTVITVGAREPETGHDRDAGVSDAPQEDVFIHILRCLPILALILTFFYLYNSRSEAQPHTQAAPENKPTTQRTEEDQEEEEEENNTTSDD